MVSDIQYEYSLGKSDHVILSFKFNNYSDLNSKDNKYTRQNFFKGDCQSLLGQLELINWDGEMDGLDLSGSGTWFTELYIDLLEKYIPESKPRHNRGKNGPPITQSCLTAIKTKHKKWLKYKYCKSHENFNSYKSARNRVTLELRNAKYAYEKKSGRKDKN